MTLRLVQVSPRRERKPWWDTDLMRSISYRALPGMTLARIMACPDDYSRLFANDGDHIRW